MQSIFVSVMAIAGLALAAPSDLDARTFATCPAGLQAVPKCCATNVLGVAGLDCINPVSLWDFQHNCAQTGRAPYCCVLPVAEQGLVCNPAIV
ncbi:hypothetical protein E4U54_002857 [Claviceps lovelessii]|nr:hypothetical protein E4U54_002857 [Claviceps lovelessii]